MKKQSVIHSILQSQRVLNHLRSKGASTTLEIRKELDILSPASAIYKLRHHDKFNIQLRLVYEATDSGVTHRVGQYILQAGQWKNNIRRKRNV